MKNIRTFRQLFVRIVIRPIFPLLQFIVVSFGVYRCFPREKFLLGKLIVPLEEAKQYLKEQGFFSNRIALILQGQVLSMRKLDPEKPDWQYHVRIFCDGEVRGHYEMTPEDHSLTHMESTNTVDREKELRAMVSEIT